MSGKGLCDQVAEYMVQRDRFEKILADNGLKNSAFEFDKADRIIADAVRQANGVLCAISSVARDALEAGSEDKPEESK